MRMTLEDLYYGNITPSEQRMVPGSEMKKAVDRVTGYEIYPGLSAGCQDHGRVHG